MAHLVGLAPTGNREDHMVAVAAKHRGSEDPLELLYGVADRELPNDRPHRSGAQFSSNSDRLGYSDIVKSLASDAGRNLGHISP